MAKPKGILLLSLLIASLSIAFMPRLSLAQEPPQPVIYLNPTPISTEPDKDFRLEFRIKYASNVYAWEVTLYWNSSVLDFVNATEGSFLKGLEETQTYMAAPVIRPRQGDEVNEELVLACTRLGAGIMGASGSADLVKIYLRVKVYGETDLNLTNTKLRDHQIDPIEHTSKGGFFSNTAGFPEADFTFTPAKANMGETITFDASSSHDVNEDGSIIAYFWDFGDSTNVSETDPIAYHSYSAGGTKDVTLQVTDNEMWNSSIIKAVKVRFDYDVMIVEVKESVENATIGDPVTITVKLSNEGANDLSGVTARAYYVTTPVGDAQTTSLAVDEAKTLSFSWDTKDVAAGSYRIKAIVDAAAGEPDEAQADNEMLGGTVTLRELPQVPWALYGGIIAVVAVVVVIGFVFMRRRGGKKQAPVK